jgi:hypothetical protein
MPPLRWPRRILDNPPPMLDWFWGAILGVTLVLTGMGAGMALCLSSHRPSPTPPPALSLHDQLHSLEQRVRVLEQR